MKRTRIIIMASLAAIIVLSAVAGAPAARVTTLVKVQSSSTIPQSYTTLRAGSPEIAQFNQTGMLGLLQSMANNPIQGGPWNGLPRVPYELPPSLLVTYYVVQATIAMNGSVAPADAAAISAWVWSCWDPSLGMFVDEYSLSYAAYVWGGYAYVQSQYSPVVATGCALDILVDLNQPLSPSFEAAVTAGIMACYDTTSYAFRGTAPAADSVDTLLDTRWALEGLADVGQMSKVDAANVATWICGLRSAGNLFAPWTSVILEFLPEYEGNTISATWEAIRSLQIIGQLSALGTAAVSDLRATMLDQYDTTSHSFFESWDDTDKLATATAAAIDIFQAIGYSTGWSAANLPATVAFFARNETITGGWGIACGDALTCASVTARVVSAVASVSTLALAGINTSLINQIFAACRVPGANGTYLGYCEYPSYEPSTVAITDAFPYLKQAGLLGSSLTSAIGRYAGAIASDPDTPAMYPDTNVPGYQPPQEYCTTTLSGAALLDDDVDLAQWCNSPFSTADFTQYKTEFSTLQVTSTPTDLVGLALSDPIYASLMSTFPQLQYRAASIESTLAAVEAMATLSSYSGGAAITPATMFNLNDLSIRLSEMSRETTTTEWFVRDGLTAYQEPAAGLDSAALYDTRLVLEIIDAANLWGNPAVASTITPAKVENFALTTPWHTADDVANTFGILKALGDSVTPAIAAQALDALAPLQDRSGWFLQGNMTSLPATLAAFSVLSQFTGPSITIGKILLGNSTETALNSTLPCVRAGATIPITVTKTNAFLGPSATPWAYSVDPLSLNGTVASGQANVTVPLAQQALGPINLTFQVPGTTFNSSVTVPLNVTGILAFTPSADPIELPAPSRQPIVATIGLRLVSPGNDSNQAPVNDGRVPVQGMTTDFDGQFARVAASPNGTYTTLLPVDPLSQTTTFRVSASAPGCDPVSAEIVVTCTDSVGSAPAILIPFSGLVAFGSVIVVRTKHRMAKI